MSTHTPRSFEVPSALVAAGFGPITDLDALDRAVEFPGEFGEWAEKVLARENSKTLTNVCGDMRLLPRGVLASVQLDDGSLLIAGLVDSDGRVWDSQSNTWAAPAEEIDIIDETVVLDDDEVAFVARAMQEGADEVWFRPYIPKAFVSAVVSEPATAETAEQDPEGKSVPAGSAIVAVVDPIDEDAVLEMLAVTPGPNVLRRHAGQWFEDPEWIGVLKSVKPPKIVKLNEAQVASVSAQVDRSTSGQEWEPFNEDNREQYQIFTASAGPGDGSTDLDEEIDDDTMYALVAVAGRELSPKDVANTERLKRYWTVGKGAAKIRWGTPGAWTRCHRHLVKYMGPSAKGYCTNLSQRLGGHGIATHVTEKHTLKNTLASADVVSRSPYLQQLQRESDEAALFALVAVAGRELTPKDVLATERLKRYWTIGRGAAKIRWGTPGSWRRCYRHLVKYVGPTVAPGYCTNLAKRLGGHGIATHVTEKHTLKNTLASTDAVTAANPQGINAYDKGKSFEEATGGVERDYFGRFAPEGGSSRSKRRESTVGKPIKTWDESKAKFKILPDEKKTKKADSEKKKAENVAQREELARISLEIAQLRADGKDIEAAELRVRYAELAVEYADTPTQKLNAQAALVNAQDALRERKYADARRRRRDAEQEARQRQAYEARVAQDTEAQNERLRAIERTRT